MEKQGTDILVVFPYLDKYWGAGMPVLSDAVCAVGRALHACCFVQGN